MPIDIIMPAMSPTMESGSVARWLVKVGDRVKPGDIIAEVETDKAIMELESMDGGVIGVVFAPDGSQGVPVGSVIGVILKDSEGESDLKSYRPGGVVFSLDRSQGSAADNGSSSSQVGAGALVSGSPSAHGGSSNHSGHGSVASAPEVVASAANSSHATNLGMEFGQGGSTRLPTDKSHPASPLARRIAKERGVDVADVFGTGTGGRVVKRDVETFSGLSSGASRSVPEQFGRVSSQRESERVPLSGMRKVIAKRLSESKSTIPHFYLSSSCDISRLLTLRAEMNANLERVASGVADKQVKVTVNDLVLKAVALAVESNPKVNVYFGGDEFIQNHSVDVCMAISLPKGLVAPKICDVNLKDIRLISQETKDIVSRAKSGHLRQDEMSGGSISVSNMGMMGVDEFFPIINPPQSCIVGVGRAVKTPVFGDAGVIVSADLVKITVSADHRVVDGADAASLLGAICDNLSNPLRLFL